MLASVVAHDSDCWVREWLTEGRKPPVGRELCATPSWHQPVEGVEPACWLRQSRSAMRPPPRLPLNGSWVGGSKAEWEAHARAAGFVGSGAPKVDAFVARRGGHKGKPCEHK
mmetsp:Transcript_51247/g.151077  ORF Transcript_51247/g.151077 Transcript_51247/m.151077 type:complete len:112 (+) Transcript_51247:1008-1343(+)